MRFCGSRGPNWAPGAHQRSKGEPKNFLRRNPEFRATRNPESARAKPGTSTRNPESTKPGILDQTKPGTGPNETRNQQPKPRIHETRNSDSKNDDIEDEDNNDDDYESDNDNERLATDGAQTTINDDPKPALILTSPCLEPEPQTTPRFQF